MKLFWHTMLTPQDVHRGYFPVLNVAPLLVHEGIDIHLATEPTLDYDVYVFNRQPPSYLWPFLHNLKEQGRKLVWHFDDDLWNLPAWNPAKRYYDMEIVNWMRDNADEVWISTEPLHAIVGRGKVLPNLIERRWWPRVARPRNTIIRLLWAGSAYHAPDVDLVADVYDRLLARYRNIVCLYFGCMSPRQGEWVQIPGSSYATLAPHERCSGRVGFIEPVTIDKFPETLVNINADISLALLEDSVFARSKSNLKLLEYGMAGIASVATDIEPYRKDGLALIGDPYDNCCRLIEDEDYRLALAARCRQEIVTNWTWDGPRRETWLEAVRSLR